MRFFQQNGSVPGKSLLGSFAKLFGSGRKSRKQSSFIRWNGVILTACIVAFAEAVHAQDAGQPKKLYSILEPAKVTGGKSPVAEIPRPVTALVHTDREIQDIAHPKKLYSVLEPARVTVAKSPVAEIRRPGTVLVHTDRETRLLELYDDYRLDMIRSELEKVDPAELSPTEKFLFVMTDHSNNNPDSIESVRRAMENDQSVYGRLVRISSIHRSRGIEEAIKLADEMAINETAEEIWAFRCMLRTYRDINIGFGSDEDVDSDYLQVATAYLDAYPDDLKAHIEFGNALKSESHEKAVDFLNTSIHKFPDSVTLRNFLGHSLTFLNRHTEAMLVYDEAIRIGPEVENLYHMRGGIAWQLGLPDQYEQDMLKAWSLNPTPLNQFERIQVLLRQDELDDAVEAATALCLEKPDNVTHGMLAIALAFKDRQQESTQAINQIRHAESAEYCRNLCRAIGDLREQRLESAADLLLVCHQWYRLAPLCSKLLSRCGESIHFGRLKSPLRLQSGEELAAGTIFRIEQRHQHRLLGVMVSNKRCEKVWIDPTSVELVKFK